MRTTLRLALALLFLAPAARAQDAFDTALGYLRANAKTLGLTPGDLTDVVATDRYVSRHNGVTHLYLRQRHAGLEVVNANMTMAVLPDGRVLSQAGRFVSDLHPRAGAPAPALAPPAAVEAAAGALGLTVTEPLSPTSAADAGATDGSAYDVVLTDGGVSREPIPVRLVYYVLPNGDLRLAWDLAIYQLDTRHWWNVWVDAGTGAVLERADWVREDLWTTVYPVDLSAPAVGPVAGRGAPLAAYGVAPGAARGAAPSYRVYPRPFESPRHAGSVTQDLRPLLADPANAAASPLGWLSDGTATYTYTRGNNVYAYADRLGNNNETGANTPLNPSPDGGLLGTFDFPVDFAQDPATYVAAATTNLFYWSNLIHDVFYRYGFDEASGNFQTNNRGQGGLGEDAVLAEAQDEGGLPPTLLNRNNANFATPADGQSGRMQMYVWEPLIPDPTVVKRDGDFDAGIIAHEYGHGISNRLTGGPGNSSCLGNDEQGGEGWSDFFALMLTMDADDTPTQRRGVGTYALYEEPDGAGIRPSPYSTSFAVNDYTYGDVGGMAVPHGVGFVWATMLWEMTWELMNSKPAGQRFDANLYNATGAAGNQVALQLVVDGLKLQPCGPGFIDARDAILAADVANYGGAHQRLIWEAFARRGLGWSASQGSAAAVGDEVEAFDLPPQYQQTLQLAKTFGPEPVHAGEFVTVTLTVTNRTPGPLANVVVTDTLSAPEAFVLGSASDGGAVSGNVVAFPAFSLAAGATATRTYRLLPDAARGSAFLFADDMDAGGASWTSGGVTGAVEPWVRTTTNPHSGTHAWFVVDPDRQSDVTLTQNAAVALPAAPNGIPALRFWHEYATEAAFDGGIVEVSTDGVVWEDAGPAMIMNGYNGFIPPVSNGLPPLPNTSPFVNRDAFTGGSGGYVQTVVDLSAYAGEAVRVRFHFGSDVGTAGTGWWVDDVELMDLVRLSGTAGATADGTVPASASAMAVVLPALASPPALQLPTSVAALAPSGGTTTAPLSVGNGGARTLDFAVAVEDGAAWLSVDPASGSVGAGGSAPVTVQFDATGLAPGTYRDTLAVFSNDPARRRVAVPVQLQVSPGTAGEEGPLAGTHVLSPVQPNPLRDEGRFTLAVRDAQVVRIALYDVQGREVALLHQGPLAAGQPYRFTVDGRALPSGLYFCRVTGETFSETRRLALVR